jgi:hypothetical protein
MEIIENEQLSVSAFVSKHKPMNTAQYFSPKSMSLQNKLMKQNQSISMQSALSKNKRASDFELPNKLNLMATDDQRSNDAPHYRLKALNQPKDMQKYASQSRMVKKDTTKSKLLYQEIAEAACEASPMADSKLQLLEGHKLFAFTETVSARQPV